MMFCQKVFVSQASPRQITEYLLAWSGGNQGALARLFELAYPELRRIAQACLAAERQGRNIQATELVHEAYLRLVDLDRMRWQDRSHFFAVGATIMRRILVEHARARSSAKRGGDTQCVQLDEALLVAEEPDRDLARLDDALEALEQFDRRKAKVVEMRYFGGLTTSEMAAVLGVSEQTVNLDWSLAKAWLVREMSRGDLDGRAALGGD